MKYGKIKKFIAIMALVALLLVAFATPALAHDGVGGDEYAAADVMLIFAMAFVVMGGIGIIYAWQNGEFRNPEKAKYSMLEMALVDEEGEDLEKYATTEVQY